MAFADHIELVGYSDLGRRPGFKLAMQEVEGRFFLYAAGMWHPGLSIVDVTDPADPHVIKWIPGPPNTWTLQVQVAQGRMITSQEPIPSGQGWGGDPDAPYQEGLLVWDVTDPEAPRLLGRWSGGARGTHRSYYDGGRYVHAVITQPGFVGRFYGAIDIEDPTDPKLVGRWWYPGQNAGAGEKFAEADQRKRDSGRPFGNEAIALHGSPYRDGDHLFCTWGRAGMVVLDVSDVTAPRCVTTFSVYPPLGSSIAVHSAIPLPDRNLVVINSEALREKRAEPLNYAGLVDISDLTDPVLISLFPVPEPPPGHKDDYWDRGGRSGPHNQHQPQGQTCLQSPGDHIFMTYFNAGLQVFDIREPRRPRIAGWYIPDEPRERIGPLPHDLAVQAEDVIVDRRGFIYMTEKNSGLYVLKFIPQS